MKLSLFAGALVTWANMGLLLTTETQAVKINRPHSRGKYDDLGDDDDLDDDFNDRRHSRRRNDNRNQPPQDSDWVKDGLMRTGLGFFGAMIYTTLNDETRYN